MIRDYFYGLLERYLRLHVRPGDRLVELDPVGIDLGHRLDGQSRASAELLADGETRLDADYVLLNGNLHQERDIQSYLERLRRVLPDNCRLIVTYYSMLWRPLARLATRLGWRASSPEHNWLAPDDVRNFLHLAGYESIQLESKVLIPVRIPLLSDVVNRWLAPLPLLRQLAMVNIQVARPVPRRNEAPIGRPSVSVVVPARNEAGNIDAIVERLPAMGPADELIFIEGGSSDDTWARIEAAQRQWEGKRRIVIGRQGGKGKGDAVRKGFELASNEILMILDADITVPPEDLPKFYRAIVDGKGEFINGSRLVYPMERHAMRFINLLGNKFFALAFSWVLGQRFKDTLCGTKVLTAQSYRRLARNRTYFGEFDPFGDFDLIFGASRMGLRIVEIPINYGERTYGETNISRWRHGALLIAMLGFAARKLKFI